MITRVLDRSEWDRLSDESGLKALLPYVSPDMVDVIAVEDEGRLVACWAVIKMTHLEGCWIDPEYRGNAGVALRLLKKAREVAGPMKWAFTGAEQGEVHVHGLIERLGGVSIPIDTYAFPMVEKCQPTR